MTNVDITDDILNRIYFISERVLLFNGLDDVFGHIVKTASILARADMATIRVFNVDTGMLDMVKGYNTSVGYLKQPPVKLGECISGKAVLTGEQIVVDDMTQYNHCKNSCDRKEMRDAEGVSALMCVPLKTRTETIGAMTVYRTEAEPFVSHDLLVLNIFASQAATAIEKTRLIDELKKQASVDMLTKVMNKRTLLSELDAKLDICNRYRYELSVLFIDIDNFKSFNDVHGHILGDKLLHDFAKLLKQHCRKSDVIGRFGGEEFVIVSSHLNEAGMRLMAEKLLKAVGENEFTGIDGKLHISFSGGVASFPKDGATRDELLMKADEAMYASKTAGKNRISVAVQTRGKDRTKHKGETIWHERKKKMQPKP